MIIIIKYAIWQFLARFRDVFATVFDFTVPLGINRFKNGGTRSCIVFSSDLTRRVFQDSSYPVTAVFECV